MKGNLKSLLAIILAIVMVFSVAGCGSKESSSKPVNNNDDFFGIDENTLANESNGDSDDDSGNQNQGGSQSGSQGNSQGNSQGGSQGNSQGGSQSGTQSVPQDAQNNKTGGKSWKEVLASMPKDLKGSTLVIYNWNPMSEYQGASSVIDKFSKQTGISVKWQVINFDQYQTTVAAAVASSTGPDLLRTRTTNPIPLKNFQPLSVSGYDFTDEAWDQQTLSDYTYNGKAYAATLKNTHMGTVNILMYNSALIDKYDLEDPYQLWKNGKWTWNKFIEVCKNFKKAAKADWAIASHQDEQFYNIFGITGPVAKKNGKFVNIATTSEFVKVAQKIADLRHTDKLYSIESEAKSQFDNGKCLFFADSSIFARSKNAFHAPLKQAGTLTAVPFPTIEGQSEYYVGSGEYEAYGIAKGAKNPKAAPYFLRYFQDASNYDLRAYYSNPNVLEVYNWSMNQKRIASIGFTATIDTAETEDDQGFYTKLVRTKSSQIKGLLESFSNVITSRANNLNKAVESLK